MKFDDILSHLGEFGPYQKRLYLLVCLTSIIVAFQTLAPVFTLKVPAHRCKIPSYNNDTYAVQNAYHDHLINQTIPVTSGSYSKCYIYDLVNVTDVTSNNQTTRECDSWVYDRSVFPNTMATDLNIVCSNRFMRSHSNMLVMAGKTLGALFQSFCSDLFGRKRAFLGCLLLLIICGFAQYFIFDFVTLLLFRFLAGFSSTSTFLGGFVIGIEFVGPSKRVFTGLITELFWVGGQFILAGFAYWLRDWQHFALALASPSVLFLCYWWLIPESPRWLLAHGREKEAGDIIRKIAKLNKVSLPEKLFDEDTLGVSPKGRIIEMFTNRTLACRSIVLFYIWMSSSLIYFGLTLNITNLSGDIYQNFSLYALVEGVGYLGAMITLDRLGRKVLLCACMIIGGLGCICSIFPVLYNENAQWVLVVLGLVGKAGSSAAYAVVYIFTAELYPTNLRNTGLGICIMMAKLGGLVSPYIADLGVFVGGQFGDVLPLVVFGAASVLAGILVFALPETLNRKLPENIEDAKHLGRWKSNTLYRLDSSVTEPGLEENGGVLAIQLKENKEAL